MVIELSGMQFGLIKSKCTNRRFQTTHFNCHFIKPIFWLKLRLLVVFREDI